MLVVGLTVTALALQQPLMRSARASLFERAPPCVMHTRRATLSSLPLALLTATSAHSREMVGSPEYYTAVYNALADLIRNDADIGPTMLRLAWHSSGTYDKISKTGGSQGGTIRFKEELAHGGNAGLDKMVAKLEPIHKRFPELSYADLYTLAGKVAVEAAGGPQIEWQAGRVDQLAEAVTPDGRLPNADTGKGSKANAAHLRMDVFYRMGFDDREIVALSGAHALGRCHPDASGYSGPWTPTPHLLTNNYSSTTAADCMHDFGVETLRFRGQRVVLPVHMPSEAAKALRRQLKQALHGREPARSAPERPSTAAAHCSAVGAGLESCVVRQLSSFTIRAATEDGEPQTTGGDDSFFVSIRGPGARVRARVADNADGTYEVLYKTEMSGTYAIFVSLLGEALPGSPFLMVARTPTAEATSCFVSGEALTSAIARVQQCFEVQFKDAAGDVAHAEPRTMLLRSPRDPRAPCTPH